MILIVTRAFTALPATGCKHEMFRQKHLFSLFLLWLGLSADANSQPILHLVVPYAAGSVQDVVARVFSDELGRRLGQKTVVENRSGAGGTIGAAFVARSLPDGLTLLVAGSSHHYATYFYPKLAYDPVKDFVGVSQLGFSGFVIAAPASMHVTNMAEYIKAVKAKPAIYNFTSAGNGSASHLGMAFFLNRSGLQMVHIPMRSTGDAVTEMLADRSQSVMAALPAMIGYRNDPRIKLLAYTATTRSPFLPEVPTLEEAGLPGFVFGSWIGLLAPAGTPKAEIERINKAVVLTFTDSAILAKLAALGAEANIVEPEKFQEMLQLDSASIAAAIRASGALVE